MSLVERIRFFVVTLFRIALYITKLCSIYTSKAKDYRYQVREGAYGVIRERRSHKVAVIGRWDAHRYPHFEQVCKDLPYPVELSDGSLDEGQQLYCDYSGKKASC